jgi:hypothetical protein
MENTEILIQEIEVFSKNGLKRKEDLALLLFLGYSNNMREAVEDLSFTSKYVQGLFRVLEKASGNADVQNLGQIKADITVNLEKVKEMIKQLISKAEESDKRHFIESYLPLTQKSLFNLTELMSDLEWTKRYLNQVKRSNTN